MDVRSAGRSGADLVSMEVVMSDARSRNVAVCFRAGRGLVVRFWVERKVLSQVCVGGRCFPWRCVLRSAVRFWLLLVVVEVDGAPGGGIALAALSACWTIVG